MNFDFVVCRQTLEHVPRPDDLLGPMTRAIGDRRVPVFFEVPNARYTLHHLFLWDIIYEHPCYYAEESLRTAFALSGLDVTQSFETFGAQYVCAAALAAKAPRATRLDAASRERLLADVLDFQRRYADHVSAWRSRIDALIADGKTVALWGAGSKGITFVNTFDLRERVSFVIDVNPRKHGMYIAGQGQRIVPPEHLRGHPVDAIVVVNPLYKHEIAAEARRLGVGAEFLYL